MSAIKSNSHSPDPILIMSTSKIDRNNYNQAPCIHDLSKIKPRPTQNIITIKEPIIKDRM
jgi:hypothetical protein